MDCGLDMTRIPRHIAIIMDGNGRWAAARGKERSFGHKEGIEAVRRITSECTRLGVDYLTLYTFSTENWNRPDDEVAALMGLVINSLEDVAKPRCHQLSPLSSSLLNSDKPQMTLRARSSHI